jgi:class 3 adenylate cyclase
MEGLTEFQPKTVAHTLFMDFVGYSRLPAAAQAQVQQILHNLTYATTPMKAKTRARNELLVKRTGDGMMMAFFDDIEAPLKVAIELDEQIKRQQSRLREQIGGVTFRVRMGVHSGPVIVLEEGGELDAAGEGINIAQRVMDAGDAEHILISDVVAQALSGDERWKALFDDLGMCRVKHDELVHLHNVHGLREDGTPIGNEALPPKVRMTQETVAQLVERDAERAREGEREIARGFFSRVAMIVGIFAVVVALGTLLIRSTKKFTQETARARMTGQQVGKAIKARRKTPPSPPASETQPNADASPATPDRSGDTGLVGGADAQVPDLKGLDQNAAQEKLATQGLKLALSQRTPERPDPTAPKGQILAQFPAAGARAGTDGTVYVTLSSGPETGGPPATGGGQEQEAISGVVVDVRSQAGFLPNQNAHLADPGGQPLTLRFQFATDEAQATRVAGGTPLKVWPTGGSSGGGILLSAEDITKIQALPDEAQGKIIVLHR